jgi:hypothetical protein
VALWNACLSWIKQGNTQVKFGDYTVTYGDQATVGQLTYAPSSNTGEPLIDQPCWWRDDSDYYTKDPDGATVHVSVAMATAMGGQRYPQASTGAQYVGVIRLIGDPYRLLRLAKVQGAAVPEADSTWSLTGATTVGEVFGADLPRSQTGFNGDELASALTVTLTVKADGTPVSITVTTNEIEGVGHYTWSKVSTPPALPTAWVELDTKTLAAAEQEGWRNTPQDAAKDVDFTVYSWDDSYQGAALQTIHVEPGSSVLLDYPAARVQSSAPGTSTIGVRPRGWVLFEYSAHHIPPDQKGAVANKRLLKSVGRGVDAYSLYTFGASPLGSTILVRRGDTYISIQATGTGLRATDAASAELTQELYAAATALRLVDS